MLDHDSAGHRWLIPGMPRRGWVLLDTYDLGEPSHECEACGYPAVRYVHAIAHSEFRDLAVGCVCAEHLTEDYVTPRQRETTLRGTARARRAWLAREWRISRKGALWLKIRGHHVCVFRSPQGDGWRCSFNDQFGILTHDSVEAAKIALFNKYRHETAQHWGQ
jgi:hypothetical protein